MNELVMKGTMAAIAAVHGMSVRTTAHASKVPMTAAINAEPVATMIVFQIAARLRVLVLSLDMPDEREISGSVPQGHVKQDQSGVEDEECEQQEDDRLHVEKRVAKGELADPRSHDRGGERLARGCHDECLVEITRALSSRSLERSVYSCARASC